MKPIYNYAIGYAACVFLSFGIIYNSTIKVLPNCGVDPVNDGNIFANVKCETFKNLSDCWKYMTKLGDIESQKIRKYGDCKQKYLEYEYENNNVPPDAALNSLYWPLYWGGKVAIYVTRGFRNDN